LLTVMAIIGLLAGLLIPAVQSARAASRRAQCVANLRQVGTAVNAYHASHNMFPPGFLARRPRPPGIIDFYSEISFLLPQLEQQPLYSSINFAFNQFENAEFPTLQNHTARNTKLAVLLCPSDGEPIHLNSYRFNRGRWGGIRIGFFDGPFAFDVFPSQASVTDGLSQTAFVSERLGGSFGVATGWPRDVKYENGPGFALTDVSYIPICVRAEPPAWATTSGRYWMFGGFYNGNYNHNGAPNDPRPSCGPGLTNGYGLHPPRSYHPGVNTVELASIVADTRSCGSSFPRSAWGRACWTLCVRSMGKASAVIRRRRASGRAFPRGAWEREFKVFASLVLSLIQRYCHPGVVNVLMGDGHVAAAP
jgi:prepilin-type processing-associated H-X9-DG protein